MKNRFIIIIISFITVFFSQSQVWASSEKLKTQTEFNNIQINKSLFLITDDSPAIITKRVGDVKEQSNWWIASIFIVGLGQIIMGDVNKGFKFMSDVYGNFILGSLLVAILAIFGGLFSFSGGLPGHNAIPSILLFGGAVLVLLTTVVYTTIFYILNIIDAYEMSKQESEISKLNDEQIAKMEKELKIVMDFATSVKVSDSGAICVRALTF